MSRRRELRDGLGSVALFSACSKRDLQIIARHTEVVELPEDTTVVEEGAPGDAFYYILAGEAVVRRRGRKVATLGAGDHFGELALLDPAPRNATVQAATALTVGVMGERIFRAILRDVPAFNEKLLRGLARRLRQLDVGAT
jgi:CRP-like cAMP-binding protein